MTSTSPTPTLTKTRQTSERRIIGRAISNIPAALAVSDILTASNFRDPLCQRLFPLILEGVEKVELDLVSITRKYNQRYGEQKAYEITMLTEKYDDVCFYIMNEAILLLETDIREKFCALLSRMERENVQAEEFEAAGIWKQCHDHLAHPGNDIFKSVDHLHSYLKNYFPDQMDEYDVLRSAVPKLVERIRKRANTRKFIDTLTVMGSDTMSHEHQLCLKIVTDWMILCVSGQKLPEKFYETLTQLNSNWNV